MSMAYDHDPEAVVEVAVFVAVEVGDLRTVTFDDVDGVGCVLLEGGGHSSRKYLFGFFDELARLAGAEA
jgi:hypothetical protein